MPSKRTDGARSTMRPTGSSEPDTVHAERPVNEPGPALACQQIIAGESDSKPRFGGTSDARICVRRPRDGHKQADEERR